MDEQPKVLLEGINALKSGQEETQERMDNMQRSQEQTKNELKEKIEKGQEETKKGQEDLKNSFEKKFDTVEEKINSVEEKIALKVEERIGAVEKKKLLAWGSEDNERKFVPASPVSVKLSTYDEKNNWEVYKTQFYIISEANGWTEGAKACQLAASLRGEAAEVLQTLPDIERLNLNFLYNALDLRFGQKYSKDYAHLQMKTRLQKTGESLPNKVAENRKFRFGLIDYPDPENLKAGVLIASSVVDCSNSVILVRMANISDKMRTIQEGEVIAACVPVTCVDRKCNSQHLSSEGLVKDLLQNTDLDEKQSCAAGGLITEFQSLFSRTSEDVGRTRLTQHRIDTGEHPPIKQHPRRLLFAKQEEVQKLIKDMKDNVIEPSSSPWASPIVLV
ncbi:retrovirus-related Pol polyprotein from transposon 412 [Trichonephila clavipes]|uniref:Retrovirus-related Pol polyprotein from transposon 412 n=1 Tax=Trichonephila clavipes TaxID=2585209 RepID=A0A8X6WDG2_TRICX|nr:retrovirus-related Pol polyprotein from transposon 412 [Trichonephila clavipes]